RKSWSIHSIANVRQVSSCGYSRLTQPRVVSLSRFTPFILGNRVTDALGTDVVFLSAKLIP
ncbi:hypothetical protein, partial [Comamonas sp. UBA7528]|uniref:hypothetical protein n=1 Tax=Comamonas sp. UBA7528 TaxID=1946391 RepID=UPI0025C54105